MNALLSKVTFGLFQRVTVVSKALPEPEPVFAERRPATGLLRTLSPEQRSKVLGYKGCESVGDDAFRLKAHPTAA
jgi:hypothetical protein